MPKKLKIILSKLHLLDTARKLFFNCVERPLKTFRARKKTKIFVIGHNKTGTTSVKRALVDLNFIVGNQREAERLSRHYHAGNFVPIINYCRTAQSFQDVPFSWPETFKHLDKAYPDARFILTVRDSEDEWLNSVMRFQEKHYGKLPTLEDMKESEYVYKGWEYENFIARFGERSRAWDEETKKLRKNEYSKHNQEVINWFSSRPNKLLVLNISEPDSYKKLCKFLNCKPLYDDFPWENKT